MVMAKRARAAETLKQPSHLLRLRASYLYPTMSERLWLLRGHVHCVEDFLDGLRFGDERDDLDFSATESTQERVNFVNFLDHLGPTEPALSVGVTAILAVLVVFIGIFDSGLSQAFCA